MVNALDELKVRAELLQRKVQAREAQASERLRKLPALRDMDQSSLPGAVRRKHCLALIAREFGFESWQHARCVLEGEPDERGFGKLLWTEAHSAFVNHWFRNHGEADEQRRLHGGYLLPYQRDFSVVTADYIAALGLDPDDPDWARMDWDWARPTDAAARERLYAKLVATRAPESA